jgi:Tetratricopeptide repeat
MTPLSIARWRASLGGKSTAVSLACVLGFGIASVASYLYGGDRVSDPPARSPRAWILGPKADGLRKAAAGEIKAALEKLNTPSPGSRAAALSEYVGALSAAESRLQKAVQASATDGRALQVLALVRHERSLVGFGGGGTQCRELLALALGRRRHDVMFQLDIVETDLRLGESEAALNLAGLAVRSNDDFGPRAVELLARYQIAPRDIARAVGTSPGALLALKPVFTSHRVLSEYLAVVEQSLSRATPELIASYADAGEQLHEWPRVRQFLKNAGPLDHPPAETARLVALSRALLALGELPQAELHARSALARDPSSARVFELLGDCLAARERSQDAVAAFNSALGAAARGITSNGQRGRLYRKIGEASERLGRGDDAYEAYRRAIELVPGDTLAEARLRALTRGLGTGGRDGS